MNLFSRVDYVSSSLSSSVFSSLSCTLFETFINEGHCKEAEKMLATISVWNLRLSCHFALSESKVQELFSQLIQATTTGGPGAEDDIFQYDKNGNMISEVRNGKKTISEYEGVGRLTKRNQQQFQYDKIGRMISAETSSGKDIYHYNDDNMLVRVDLSNGSRKEYKYDPLGRLIVVKRGNETRHIIWDINHRLMELDGDLEMVKLYIYGPGG